jgi:hypothetical protein
LEIKAGANIKAAVLIAVIAAWALIAVADIIGRAIAKAATERAQATTRAAEIAAATQPATNLMATALPASNLDGADKSGFLAVATRSMNAMQEVMLVKATQTPIWVPYDQVEFPPPAA